MTNHSCRKNKVVMNLVGYCKGRILNKGNKRSTASEKEAYILIQKKYKNKKQRGKLEVEEREPHKKSLWKSFLNSLFLYSHPMAQELLHASSHFLSALFFVEHACIIC